MRGVLGCLLTRIFSLMQWHNGNSWNTSLNSSDISVEYLMRVVAVVVVMCVCVCVCEWGGVNIGVYWSHCGGMGGIRYIYHIFSIVIRYNI